MPPCSLKLQVMKNPRLSTRLASEPDAKLLRFAQSGDRTAFGVLYLRHHEAAWRMANAVTAFSPESSGVVVESFARVVATPPLRIESNAALRPALFICVRQVALDGGAPSGRSPSPFAPGSGPNGELVIGDVNALAVDAFRRVAEPERTALWLSELEVLTPKEVSVVMGLSPTQAAALAVKGHYDLTAALVGFFATGGHQVCRRVAPHLAGVPVADDRSGQDLAEHLAHCAPCRIRRSEVADVAAALRAAIPPAPLLGHHCQHLWSDQRNGRRSLPPGDTR